eukprot:9497846-Ditylum_brightwellii.AAC.1
MMLYLCKRIYPTNKKFSTRELACLKPHGIYRWLAMKAYGKDEPSISKNPTKGRSTSQKYYKRPYLISCPIVAWCGIS